MGLASNNKIRTFHLVPDFISLLSLCSQVLWTTLVNFFLQNLLKKDNSTLCKHVFLWDYSLCNNNWCSYVKQIFDSCNLDDFDNQSICSVDICKMKLQYIECSEWKEKLNSKPKLRSYKQFKSEKQIENYIKLNLSNKERSFLAQLRMGTLPLFIEMGRYTKVPVNQRFCFNCPNSVEDEFHFCFSCPVYNKFRSELNMYVSNMGVDLSALSAIEKFKVLSEYFPRQLAKYVCKAFNERTALLYSS